MEMPISNTFYHSDIFNDSAIHWFPAETLATAPDIVWKDNTEPMYSADDPEIVTSNEKTPVL